MIGTVYHISHTDLDGVGCQIVSSHIFKYGAIKFYNANYNDVDQVIAKVIGEMRKDDRLLITDLSPCNPETIDLLDNLYNKSSVTLIDHHKTAMESLHDKPWAKIDLKFCATKLLYNYMHCYEIEELAAFTNIVNDYDLWIHKDARSSRFNTLLHGLGIEDFRCRFQHKLSLVESETESKIIDILIGIDNSYVRKAVELAKIMTDDSGTQYALVFAERMSSNIGESILSQNPQIQYVLIINAQNKTASLRSRKGEYDVSALAKSRGGGGHQPASGYRIQEIKVS